METVIKNELKHLFLQNHHAGVFEKCEHLLNEAPEDIEILYCTAMAAITLNETEKSLAYLDRLVRAIVQAIQQPTIGDGTLFFSGRLAIQVPKLLEHLDGVKKAEIFNSAVECAKSISQKTADKKLKQTAENYGDRILKIGRNHLYILPKTPLDIQVEGTNHCNLKCTMCPRIYMKRDKGYMDIELWEKVILGWSGKNNKLDINHLVFDIRFAIQYLNGSIKMFFMGEPLLHPKFDQFIQIAKKHGGRIGIQTNGVMLKKPKIRERLINAAPDELFLSLDGVDTTSYNDIRKGSNWSYMIKSVRELSFLRKANGLEKNIMLGVSTILPDNTQDTVNKILAFLDPIRPYVDSINGIPLNKSYSPVFFDTEGNLQKYDKPIQSHPETGQPLCEEPFKKLNILWDGTVTPCCNDIDGAIKLGDARTHGIDKIWGSKKTRSLHLALLSHDIKAYPLCCSCKG